MIRQPPIGEKDDYDVETKAGFQKENIEFWHKGLSRLGHFYYNKGKRNDSTMETTSFP